jgi:hypothetical protein
MSTSLRDLKSKMGYFNGGRPDNFELGAGSTLHFTSSTNGKPPFASYKDAYLRRQRPVNPAYLFPENPVKYLDNPPH